MIVSVISTGQLDILKELKNWNLSLEEDDTGSTSIHHAVRAGQGHVLAELHSWGVDIDHVDHEGSSAMDLAVRAVWINMRISVSP